MQMVEVIRIGSHVLIGNNEIRAIVTGVRLHGSTDITYECAWWNGRDRIVAELDPAELSRPDEGELDHVGFT